MKRKARFRVGQRIRVLVRGLPYARIEGFYSDIEGGARLDREIQGFYSWNVENLRSLTRREKEGKRG